jgi:hypothetical protein
MLIEIAAALSVYEPILQRVIFPKLRSTAAVQDLAPALRATAPRLQRSPNIHLGGSPLAALNAGFAPDCSRSCDDNGAAGVDPEPPFATTLSGDRVDQMRTFNAPLPSPGRHVASAW